MDDKGYAFTPLAFLLLIPVFILAVSYNGIVNEVNTLSAIVIGGDVTVTVANGIVTAIKQDTADAGRNSAFKAVRKVIDGYNLLPTNNPYFGTASTTDSKSYIISNTLNMLNSNITNTTRDLESETGRLIYINGNYVDPDGTGTINIFQTGDVNITQSDPFGFNVTVKSVPIKVVQNSTNAGQSVEFNTPTVNVYVPIDHIEDPYVWVNTKARVSLVIIKYPYYTSNIAFNSTSGDYHFDDNVSYNSVTHLYSLNHLYDCLAGTNATLGYRPYYFPDTHGLTFFDRLENRTTSNGPPEARMSTFILNDPLINEHGNRNVSFLDHEYFAGTSGTAITINGTAFKDPTGRSFILSTIYRGYLGLSPSYSYP